MASISAFQSSVTITGGAGAVGGLRAVRVKGSSLSSERDNVNVTTSRRQENGVLTDVRIGIVRGVAQAGIVRLHRGLDRCRLAETGTGVGSREVSLQVRKEDE